MKSECRVQLIGQEIDLKIAMDYFETDLFSIVKFDEEFFICSNKFNDTKDTNKVSEIAKNIIEKINGILKLKFQGYNNVSLGSLFIFEDEQGINRIIEMFVEMSGRGILYATTNNTEEEKKNQNNRTENLLIDSKIKDVFHFYSQPTTWINLYKIYEIIRDDTGDKRIIQFLSKKELSRFKATAQSRKQIGDNARHAAKKFIGHTEPMTIEEADCLIKTLITNWTETNI